MFNPTIDNMSHFEIIYHNTEQIWMIIYCKQRLYFDNKHMRVLEYDATTNISECDYVD